MSTSEPLSTAQALGIHPGYRVRVIGNTHEIDILLGDLPDGVTVTSIASKSVNVGVIVVDDERDLRERLFTELDSLIGATQVWILSRTGTGPGEDSIRTEAGVVSWEAITTLALGTGWLAVALSKK